ncbi:MAG: tetratricopeptide repeat protein [Syntrophales bacterium]
MKKTSPIGRSRAAPLLLLLCVFTTSCYVPKIIIMDDPLSAEQHNDLGVIYEKKGDRELARKEYASAIDKKSDWMMPYFNMGNLYYQSGDYSEAEVYYRKALKRSPDNPDVMNNLANALLMQGKGDEAMSLVEKAIMIVPKEEYRDTQRRIVEEMSKAKK